MSAERYRTAGEALGARERASAKLLIWGARAESARAALADAETAEREQADRVERARQVFTEARDAEAVGLDAHADAAVLVHAATRASTAADADRALVALTDARQAREAAELTVVKAERRVRRAQRKADRAEHVLAGPGPEAVLLVVALLPRVARGAPLDET